VKNITKKSFLLLIMLILYSVCPLSAFSEESKVQPSKSDINNNDNEVLEILDEESDVIIKKEDEEEAQKKKKPISVQPKLPKKKSRFIRAVTSLPDKIRKETLSKSSKIDWDASFREEFEREENEIVTPSLLGIEENVFLVTPPASVLSHNDFFETNASDLSGILGRIPGLFLIKIQDFAHSPVLRGMGGSRIRLLFDGIRLNTPSSPSEMDYLLSTIDFPSLAYVEVIGAPSVTGYGTSAIGGIINFIPQLTRVNPFISMATDSKIFLRYNTTDFSSCGHASTSLHTFDSGIVASVTYENHEELNDGKEKQPFTGFSKVSANFSAEKKFDESNTLRFGYFLSKNFHAERQILYPQTGENDELEVQNHIFWNQIERHLIYLKYENSELRTVDKIRVTLGTQLFKDKFNENMLNLPQFPRILKKNLSTGNFFSLISFGANLGSWGYLIYGLDWYGDVISSKGKTIQSISKDISVTYPSRGVFEDGDFASELENYARLDLFFLNPVLITLGGRVVWDNMHLINMEDKNKPGGGAQIEVRIPLAIRIGYSKIATLGDILALSIIGSFISRPPTLDELSSERAVAEGILFGNPELENENVVAIQGGLKWNANIVEGGVFYGFNHFESEIIQVNSIRDIEKYNYDFSLCTEGIQCWVNINGGKANLHSVEFVNRINVKDFIVIGMTLSYTHGTHDSPSGAEEPMSGIPPLFGSLWMRGIYKPFGLWGEFQLNLGWRQNNLSEKDKLNLAICPDTQNCKGSDEFILLAIRGGVKITDRFFLSIAFTNILNRLEKLHGGILYEPGLGASVSFEGKL